MCIQKASPPLRRYRQKDKKQPLKSAISEAVWSEWNYRILRNYEQQKWYSGSRQSVFPPILNREHLRRLIGQGAAFFFSQLRDKLSQSSAIGRRWELSLVLLALDFFF